MSSEDLRVVVLAGGLTYEREVSLVSGRRLVDALHRVGAEPQLLDADADLLPRLEADPPDAVFLALHGQSGEDGSLRTVLELLGIPYVGTSAAAARVAWDKPNAKALVRAANIDTPDWVALPHDTFREFGADRVLDPIVRSLGLPLMVKPATGGSALGAVRVGSTAELPAAMVRAFAYGSTVLVEPYLRGLEVAVCVADRGHGPQALPAVEIIPPEGIFDYTARYSPGVTQYHTPARLPPDVASQLGDVAVHAHRALGLRDLSRMDAIITAPGRIQFLEVNVAPGLTETSLLPMALDAAAVSLGDFAMSLLRIAVSRP